MPWGLKHFQQSGQLHFLTFSCYRRRPNFAAPHSRACFESSLERGAAVLRAVRVRLRRDARARSSAGQRTGTRLFSADAAVIEAVGGTNPRLCERRNHFGRRVTTTSMCGANANFVEKLRYIHRNPVVRGLVERPEDWLWSSFRHYFTGADGVVEIESQWTARRREKLGIMPTARVHENPAQAKLERGTLKSRLGG